MRVVALLCAALALTPAVAGAVTERASLADVEDEVMCIVCGTLLAESEAPQADRERALIRKLIAHGETKDQIEDALVSQYGPRVLATPSGHGFDLLAWIVPALGILIAAAGLAFATLRLRHGRGDRNQPPRELDPADADRLDRDLSSFDR
jgi:cytochrome c-type biogenesis protein CcmH